MAYMPELEQRNLEQHFSTTLNFYNYAILSIF